MAGPGAPVWSLPLRALHWALAACIGVCLVQHHGGTLHEALGYAALALAALRIAWGLRRGAGVAAFARFVHGPAATWAYARALRRGDAARHLGHNPLGAWMILALLATAVLAGGSGALFATDRFWGDPLLAELHFWCGWAFAVLVPLHLGGVALSSWRQRENLVAAMIHGRKRPAGPGDHPA